MMFRSETNRRGGGDDWDPFKLNFASSRDGNLILTALAIGQVPILKKFVSKKYRWQSWNNCTCTKDGILLYEVKKIICLKMSTVFPLISQLCPLTQCLVPENKIIYTPPTEGIGNSWGGGGPQRPKKWKKCMRSNWNVQRGYYKKSLPWGRDGYFIKLQNSLLNGTVSSLLRVRMKSKHYSQWYA